MSSVDSKENRNNENEIVTICTGGFEYDLTMIVSKNERLKMWKEL